MGENLMASAVVAPDTEYSLAEKAILSEGLPSASTLPDVLARPVVIAATAEPTQPILQKVAIRKRGSEILVEVRASVPLPRPFIKGLEGIAALLTLLPGWNSYSAKPIAPENAIRAIRLVWDILQPGIPAPMAVPRVRGGIQLEWHTESGDIEIYIDSPGQVTFFAEHAESGENIEAPLAGHEDALKAWVQRISGK
jgi:hypothetical protein